MALATVHAGLASLAGVLGVSAVACSTATEATTTASSASFFYLVEAFVDGIEGVKDGVLVGSNFDFSVGTCCRKAIRHTVWPAQLSEEKIV